MISLEEVKKIARLARIKLTPAEERRHAATMTAVLDYMKILNEVNTDDVEPTAQVTGLSNVMREDIAVPADNKKELMAQMPEVYAGELKVPGVFAEEQL
ncbi:MAG: Asp-tRNA(Asn)/Glu-tRNA(Gln) amidotransferase subunit GatC [Patescibacteria group bacterium]|nr:Asp-tRNA(Asn)/Glu-tRNA(Gln) amidotransferase subunit GatC [Patescibacteria group bacterium]